MSSVGGGAKDLSVKSHRPHLCFCGKLFNIGILKYFLQLGYKRYVLIVDPTSVCMSKVKGHDSLEKPLK